MKLMKRNTSLGDRITIFGIAYDLVFDFPSEPATLDNLMKIYTKLIAVLEDPSSYEPPKPKPELKVISNPKAIQNRRDSLKP